VYTRETWLDIVQMSYGRKNKRNARASPCVLLEWHRCNFFD